MTDDDFVRAFRSGTLSPAQFHHRDHLRLAWCLVRTLGVTAATHAMSTGIRHVAA